MSIETTDLLREVLEKIRPRQEEITRAREIFRELRERLEPYFSDVSASIELHGSVEKDTALSGDLDLDVFVLVPKELGREWIRKEFIKRAREALRDYPYEERYAEHPYLRVRINNRYEADVVPALRIDDPRESVTIADRTPFHTRYIKSVLDESKRDEVRLLKRFMKGVGVYGAEIKIGGFSGYLTELLIARYGSFLEVIRAASQWRAPVIVTLDSSENPSTLKRLFPDASFIFPDPVDPRRNAAAAVREDTLSRFIIASKNFLEEPSLDYFFPPQPPRDRIKKRVEELCFLVFEIEIRRRESPDNIWGQLNRLKRRLFNTLTSEGYEPVYIDIYWDEKDCSVLYIELPSEYCEKGYLWRVIEGPPVHSSETNRFIEKQLILGEGFWVRGDRLFGRRKKSLEDLVKRINDLSSLEIIRLRGGVDREKIASICSSGDYATWLGETVLKIPRYLFRKISDQLKD